MAIDILQTILIIVCEKRGNKNGEKTTNKQARRTVE